MIDIDELHSLRADFRWGAATAAYQVEGATDADGRGPSNWDTFGHTPGLTLNGDTGDIAADHYHRYPDDLQMAAEFGIGAYRFSIAWPRIFPDSSGCINHSGLDHYSRMVDTMLELGIEPLATIFHWDLPQWLEDTGGWYNRDTAQRYAEYADVVIRTLSDRVPRWITINEPWTVVGQGYCRGIHAPGYHDYHTAGTAIHHLMLASGLAVQAFRAAAVKDVEIGITLSMAISRPWSQSPNDCRAAELLDGEQNRVYLDPLFLGSYPKDLSDLFPTLFDDSTVLPDDLAVISSPIDFLGVNYYLNHLVRHDATIPILAARQIHPQGPMMSAGIAAVPAGIEDCLLRIRREYKDIPIYVTEMGASLPDYVDPTDHVHDSGRIEYLKTAISSIASAASKGVDVRGFYVWSLLDNLEWELGYSIRFGLFFVDFGTQRRIPKDSAYWYRDVIAQHAAMQAHDKEG